MKNYLLLFPDQIVVHAIIHAGVSEALLHERYPSLIAAWQVK